MISFAKVKKSMIKLLVVGLFSFGFALLNSQPVFTRPTLKDALGNTQVVAQGAGVGDKASVSEIMSSVIITSLSIIGILFFLLICYGGFNWMMARGNDVQITKSKNTIIAAVIGLVIVLGAYAITAFVSNFMGP